MAAGAHDHEIGLKISSTRQERVANADTGGKRALDARRHAVAGEMQRDVDTGRLALVGLCSGSIDSTVTASAAARSDIASLTAGRLATRVPADQHAVTDLGEAAGVRHH